MASVLLGMAWPDALDGNAEPEPPDGELGEIEEGVRAGEGDAGSSLKRRSKAVQARSSRADPRASQRRRNLEAWSETVVDRLDGDHWEIPRDFLERAAAYDERTGRKVVVAMHSAVPLDRQIDADAATWLDRQLVGRHRVETDPMGFGSKVEQALQERRQQR